MITIVIITPRGRNEIRENHLMRRELFGVLDRMMDMLYRKEFHEWEGVPVWFWPRIAHHLTPLKRRPFLRSQRKGGRPRGDDRRPFGAILWRLRCGGAWRQLPKRFGSSATAVRRLRLWRREGRLEFAWRAYLSQQSRHDLTRWRDSFAASRSRAVPFWRWSLYLIWKTEFEPTLPKEL